MTNAKSQYARDARHDLIPHTYTGETVPPRAGGLSTPLPTGTIVYPVEPAHRGFVTVNLRSDGFGASFYLRAKDVRPLEVVS
jgi:hypothetical protein